MRSLVQPSVCVYRRASSSPWSCAKAAHIASPTPTRLLLSLRLLFRFNLARVFLGHDPYLSSLTLLFQAFSPTSARATAACWPRPSPPTSARWALAPRCFRVHIAAARRRSWPRWRARADPARWHCCGSWRPARAASGRSANWCARSRSCSRRARDERCTHRSLQPAATTLSCLTPDPPGPAQAAVARALALTAAPSLFVLPSLGQLDAAAAVIAQRSGPAEAEGDAEASTEEGPAAAAASQLEGPRAG